MLFLLIFFNLPRKSIFFLLHSSYVIFLLSSTFFTRSIEIDTEIAYVIDPQWMDGLEHDRSFRNRFGKLPHLQSPYRNTSVCIYGYVHNVAIL